MPPTSQTATPNSIVHPSNSAGGGGTTVVGGGDLKGSKPHHEIILGVVSVITGVLLPFLGFILGSVTFTKGLRQSRKVLLALGLLAIVSSVGGGYVYWKIYDSNTHKTTSQAQVQNVEEANPDGFDSLGIK